MEGEWQARGRDFLMEHAARGDQRAAEILRASLLPQQRSNAQETHPAQRVVIGLCTARRPGMLTHCLNAIAAQIIPPSVEAHLVVADNEAEPNNRRLVNVLDSDHCPLTVHYVHERRRGIPQARNAILREARALGADWIAMTDDDCWVSPSWLAELLAAAARHKADVIYGRRELLYPLPALWVLPEGANQVEGQTLPFAATHNVLMAGWLIREGDGQTAGAGLTFDERLAHGEDTDFFHRAAKHGARIVYSREPVVLETVTPERATLGYQTRRAYHYAASRSYFHRRYKGYLQAIQKLAARWLFHVPVAILRLASAPFVWPFSELAFRDLIIKGAARLAGAVGATAGLLGFDGNPYRVIDGY